jgi:hypothetical protein
MNLAMPTGSLLALGGGCPRPEQQVTLGALDGPPFSPDRAEAGATCGVLAGRILREGRQHHPIGSGLDRPTRQQPVPHEWPYRLLAPCPAAHRTTRRPRRVGRTVQPSPGARRPARSPRWRGHSSHVDRSPDRLARAPVAPTATAAWASTGRSRHPATSPGQAPSLAPPPAAGRRPHRTAGPVAELEESCGAHRAIWERSRPPYRERCLQLVPGSGSPQPFGPDDGLPVDPKPRPGRGRG